MLRQTLFSSLVVSLAAVCVANAQEPRDFSRLPVQAVQLPGTGYEIVFNSPELQVGERRPMRPLSTAIASWLAANLEFATIRELPRVDYVSPMKIALLRHGGPLLKGDFVGLEVTPLVASEIATFYDDRMKVIYMPEGWNGSTPAEISVFVGAMVHHLQNEAGLKYESTDARDKPAAAAQKVWLTMFSVPRTDGTVSQGQALSIQ